MNKFSIEDLKKLYIPDNNSHKGQNGKLLVIGGSILFHSASLWVLDIASRIVDMVYYSSVKQNNEIVLHQKEVWRNGIIVPREKINHYIEEADAIVIGPGLPREEGREQGDDDTKTLTETLLKKYPEKKWVIDGGSLQVIQPDVLPKDSIITPHHGEFEKLFGVKGDVKTVEEMAEKYSINIILKGSSDLVCSNKGELVEISGGNAGMTKGGTGDVLAGLTGALLAKNDPFLSAKCASFLNKKAGEALFEKVGVYFNASDLVNEIPAVMKRYLL